MAALTALYCARACVIARRHLDDCDDDTCRGCLPRPADFGALCIGDHYRLARMLHDLPHARTLLDGHLAPGQAPSDTGKIKRTKGDPPAPLRVAVLDLIRDIDDLPLAWARIHAEERDLTAPRDGITHLRTHLASVECSEWIVDMWDELAGLISQAHALVPWRPETTYLSAPCPECHCAALALYGGDDWVTCRECRTVIPQDRYGMWARLLIHDRQRQDTAA